jgi:hypothetical protein
MFCPGTAPAQWLVCFFVLAFSFYPVQQNFIP